MIRITRITEKPLHQMGQNAGYCYNTTNEKWFPRIAKQCLSENHGRVMEFPEVEFEYSEYSGKVIRELFRHVHLTGLQESTRYVPMENYEAQVPPSVKSNPEALEQWNAAIEATRASILKLKEAGVPVEDYSNLLPLAYNTKGVFKIGLRELIHMFEVRSCTTAYHEARKFMAELKKAIIDAGDDEWKFIAEHYFHPKCHNLLYCPEEKRWSLCKRKPTKTQARKVLEEYMNNTNWRELP
jgi:flavin-dependent thymidylate synthase